MNDQELAEYYFPHCMMHWPNEYKKFAEEARQMLKFKHGKRKLIQLRKEHENILKAKGIHITS